MMFHSDPGHMRRSVVDPVNHEIAAEPEASAELVENLREVDEALQLVYERTVSEIWNCYVEMFREVNEALRILYEKLMSELSTYYTPIPSKLNEGPYSQCGITDLELWSSSIETLIKLNEALGGVGHSSELVTAMESNNLLKEYGSQIDARAFGFSLN